MYILYKRGDSPPSLLIAVVHFPDYSRPTWNNTPKPVPIYSITFEWHNNNKQLARQQLPLHLRYAITT